MGAALVIAVLLVGYVVKGGQVPSPATTLAQCLTEKGVKMFGAWWCPHCTKQKSLFGNAFQYVEYVECSPGGTKTMSAQCQGEGIKGYPTWRFADGTELNGEQELAALATKAGCEAPAPAAE